MDDGTSALLPRVGTELSAHQVPEIGSCLTSGEFVQLPGDEHDIYEPLDASKNEVRLLKLQPSSDGTWKDCIECTMIKSQLDVEYFAISYVWGSRENPGEIIVNGRTIRVTRNLYDLLSVFRQRGTIVAHYVWIDALCINQADTKERNELVQRMGDIYRRAEAVLIWLGGSTPATPRLFERLKEQAYHTESNTEVPPVMSEEELWTDFCRVVGCSWFRRIWVVQEAMLAKRRIAWCGQYVTSLDLIINACDIITGAAYEGMRGLRPGVTQEYIFRHFTSALGFKRSHEGYHSSTIKGILTIFMTLRTSRCSDFRDHIYGLLGLLPETLVANIRVDYSLTVPEVFTEATYGMLMWSRSLEPLRLCMRGPTTAPDLPSWVPDYRQPSPFYRNHDHSTDSRGDDYNASANAPFYAYRSVTNELTVHALVLDEIAHHSPYAFTRQDEAPGPGMPDHDVEPGMRKILRRWGALSHNFARRNGRDEAAMELAFWQVIAQDKIANVEPLGQDANSWDAKFVDAKVAEGLTRWLVERTADHEYQDKVKMHVTLLTMFYTRLARQIFFITEQGHMGIVPEEGNVGDVVAVLAGMSRPVVLRRMVGKPGQKYSFIGPCYCDGMMFGEAVQQSAKQGSRPDVCSENSWDAITLV